MGSFQDAYQSSLQRRPEIFTHPEHARIYSLLINILWFGLRTLNLRVVWHNTISIYRQKKKEHTSPNTLHCNHAFSESFRQPTNPSRILHPTKHIQRSVPSGDSAAILVLTLSNPRHPQYTNPCDWDHDNPTWVIELGCRILRKRD